MKTYLATYLGAFFVAVIITPLVIRLAEKFDLYDRDSHRKVHTGRIARVGGIAIYSSMLLLVGLVLILPNKIGDSFRQIGPQIVAVLFAATFMFIIGLVDDIKGVSIKYKFIAQFAAAIFVCSFGIRIEILSVPELFTIRFGLLSWPLTIIWIVGITNAVNFIDGLDGLAAGISAIACGVVATLAFFFEQPVLSVMMLALAGALMGFLIFNFNPAKIFMGDSGSLFLGFTISTAAVMCTAKSQMLIGFALPILALGIPIFDTLFIMLRRFGERRSMFVADKEHFHHRLLRLGFKQRHVVIVAYAVTLLAAGAGLFLMIARSVKGIVLFVSVLVLIVLLFYLAGSVGIKQLVRAVRRKYN